MTPLTDRQASELLWPLASIMSVLRDGVEDKGPEYTETMRLLSIAEAEVIALHGGPDGGLKIKRRVERMLRLTLDLVIHNGAEVEKIGLIVFFVVQALVDGDCLVYNAGSAIDKSLMAFVESISHGADSEKVVRSAQKQAGKMLSILQSQGYYTSLLKAKAA